MAQIVIPIQFFAEPSTTSATIGLGRDVNANRYVGRYAGSTVQQLWWSMPVPPHCTLINSFTFRYSNIDGSTGNIRWALTAAALSTSTMVPSLSLVTSSTDTPIQSSGSINSTTYSWNLSTSLNARQLLNFYLWRDATNALDSSTGNAEVYDVVIDYNADVSDGRAYVWMPANAWLAHTTSGAVLSKHSSAFSWTRALLHTTSTSCHIDFTIPNDCDGNVYFQPFFWWSSALGGNYYYQVDYALGNVGDTSDPSWSLLATGTFNVSSATSTYRAGETAMLVPGSPTARTHIHLRVSRLFPNAADTTANTLNFLGGYLYYDKTVFTQSIILDANTALGTASVSKTTDNVSQKWVGSYPNGSSTYLDFPNYCVPADYYTNVVARIRWRVRGTSTGSVIFVGEFATPATNGGIRDSAYDSLGSVTGNVVASSNLIHQESVISSFTNQGNWTIGDLINFRLTRRGDVDTLASPIDILQVNLEYQPF